MNDLPPVRSARIVMLLVQVRHHLRVRSVLAAQIGRPEIHVVVTLDEKHAIEPALAAECGGVTQAFDEDLGLPEFGRLSILGEVTRQAENDRTFWVVMVEILRELLQRGRITATCRSIPRRRLRRIKPMPLPKMKIGQMNNDHLSRHMICRDSGRHKGVEQSITFTSSNRLPTRLYSCGTRTPVMFCKLGPCPESRGAPSARQR